MILVHTRANHHELTCDTTPEGLMWASLKEPVLDLDELQPEQVPEARQDIEESNWWNYVCVNSIRVMFGMDPLQEAQQR